MNFFYVVDFPQKKLSWVKIGITKDLTRRLEQERRQYGGKGRILYVKCCETTQECDDLEDLARVILRRTPGFIYKAKDRFIYNKENRPSIPIPKSANVDCEVCYI